MKSEEPPAALIERVGGYSTVDGRDNSREVRDVFEEVKRFPEIP